MLGQPVIAPAAGPAAAGQGGTAALMLTCIVPSGSSSATFKAPAIDALIGTWLGRAAAAAGRGSSQLALLAAAHQRLPAQLPDDEGARGLVLLLQRRLLVRLLRLLGEDEEDLFYESGRSYTEFRQALAAPVCPLPLPFLAALLSAVASPEDAAAMSKVVAETVRGFAAFAFTGGVAQLEPLLLALDRATQEPRMLLQLASSLAQELLLLPPPGRPPAPSSAAAAAATKQLAKGGALAPLLNVSSAADSAALLRTPPAALFASLSGGTAGGSGGGGSGSSVSAAAAAMSPAAGLFTCLRSYPRNAGEADGARRLLQGLLGRVAEAAAQLAKRLAALKAPGLPPGGGREVLLAWLAAVAAANEERCRGGEYSALRYAGAGAPDGFMLTLTAAVLRLARPFVAGYLAQSPKFTDLLTRHLSPSYYKTHSHRLGSATAESTLSGQRGVLGAAAAGSSGGSSRGFVVAEDPAAAAAAASFIAETFFIGQRYLRVGLMPAVARYQKLNQHLWDTYSRQLAAAGGGGGGRREAPAELSLLRDCSGSQLLQPDMTADAVQFAVVEIIWLADLVSQQQQQQQQGPPGSSGSGSSGSSPLDLVPDSVLADAAAWLTFVIQSGEAEQLAAVPIGLLMQSISVLLANPAQVRSLLVVAKLVRLLLVMLAPQVNLAQRTVGALGRDTLSSGESALVAAVLGSPATQGQLVPALMAAYGAADFVVGLDVDKDEYDKFTMRHQIDQIILELWRDERCKASIKALAAAAAAGGSSGSSGGSSGGEVFTPFVSSLLNDLMYLFKDSLERLADIKQIEDSKADEAAWAALSDPERSAKEEFYRGQASTAGGFMSLALTTLELLTTLTGDRDIAATFMVQPLLGRTAFAVLHFLELLVGRRCATLDVKNPKKYHFDRPGLLCSVSQLALQLAAWPAFAAALAEEPDFEEATLQAAVDSLNQQHAYGAADGLAALLAAVAGAHQQQRTAKKQRLGGTAAAATAGDAAAAAAAGSSGAAPGPGSSEAEVAAAVDARVAGWLLGLGGAAEAGFSSPEAADAAYRAALEPLAVGSFDAGLPGAYNSQFAGLAAQPQGDTSQKMRRLGRELRDLRGKTRLPIAAAAACFVRQDQERPDKVRCIITGPMDTPYEGGLFVFDVFFPAGYPQVPPLMVLDTTGGGRARFNPNLYADGKVCMSLLGTWHGGDEASKWNPASSSLFQILLSLQGMVFVEDPYFNEPNVEGMRGTTEGNLTSIRYNADLRLATLRWAVTGLIRAPPPGLEELVAAHFRVLRGLLVSRSGRWLREAAAADASGTAYSRLAAALDELVPLLAAL